ncbi:hypothetical protein IAD21_06034 [Abditibacteriota bacterium]|nr:hypothetical protein IAD21_06034 [Abditibacteriota bacterium]
MAMRISNRPIPKMIDPCLHIFSSLFLSGLFLFSRLFPATRVEAMPERAYGGRAKSVASGTCISAAKVTNPAL